MELLLDRDLRTTKSTGGKLYIDGVFECFTLEDVDRGLKQDMPVAEVADRKIKHETCIPEGRYQVIINQSVRFKRLLPLLLNVPGYTGIRIHSGNTEANTSGCILPGRARYTNEVRSSRTAFDALFLKMQAAIARDEKIFITIQ